MKKTMKPLSEVKVGETVEIVKCGRSRADHEGKTGTVRIAGPSKVKVAFQADGRTKHCGATEVSGEEEFKVGDKVEVLACDADTSRHVGHKGSITAINYTGKGGRKIFEVTFPETGMCLAYRVKKVTTAEDPEFVRGAAPEGKKIRVGDKVEILLNRANSACLTSGRYVFTGDVVEVCKILTSSGHGPKIYFRMTFPSGSVSTQFVEAKHVRRVKRSTPTTLDREAAEKAAKAAIVKCGTRMTYVCQEPGDHDGSCKYVLEEGK